MKTRRFIYIIFGVLFILLDAAATFNNWNNLTSHTGFSSYGLGYLIGSQIFLYIGLLFFYGSYRVAKKLKEKQQHEWEEEIRKIGQP